MSRQLTKRDLADIEAREKAKAEALPYIESVLARNTKSRTSPSAKPSETLEGIFGEEVAARMRREAKINARRDGLKD